MQVVFVCVHNAGRSQMAEVGVSIAGHQPKLASPELVAASDRPIWA